MFLGKFAFKFRGQLRDELKHKYHFISESDTEVVLYAYKEWGAACLQRLNGMWAFVIYDRQEKKIFGARDRFGVKPFYYHHGKEFFAFASEIKAILSRQGYTAVPLLLKKNKVYAVGAVNGVSCHFIVDTGGFLTALDARFAVRTKLNVGATPIVGQGLGGSSPVGITKLTSLRIGNYEIKNASASVAPLNPAIFEANSDTAGLLGAEYLAINRAIVDFVSGTLYLRPPGR